MACFISFSSGKYKELITIILFFNLIENKRFHHSVAKVLLRESNVDLRGLQSKAPQA